VGAERSDSGTSQPLPYRFGGPPADELADGCQQLDLAHESFRRVLEYVDAHLDSKLDIHALARIAAMPASQFNRSFPRFVGVSPHRYVVQCRLKRARELLATTQLSLTEIALTSGFADHSHFSRCFHALIGMTPKRFRRLARCAPR
jgi:AraC family transcriptional regulator